MIQYLEKPAGTRLEAHVECLWLAWTSGPLEHRETQRVVPDACPELLLQLEDPFERWVDGAWRTQPKVFVAGTLTAPWLLRPGPRVRTLGARFRPGALTTFLAIDMKNAVDREVPLASVVGQVEEEALVETLGASEEADQLFERLGSWLLARLPGREQRRRESLSDQAVRRVLATQGRITIAKLATALSCHRRTLERGFSRDLGITPKYFARIVRLNAVLAGLDGPGHSKSVDLALDMGFFDQAHLLRDARLIAGRRLSTSREEDGALARHFTDSQRLRQLLSSAYHGPQVSHFSKPPTLPSL